MDTSLGKLRLDIPVVLPHVRDAADACIERLQSELLARPGVDRVHIRPAEGEGLGQLCVHFDPQVMSLARIRELTQAAGARVTESFGHLTWTVTGIGHERRARTVAEQMSSVFGVLEARASSAGTVYLEFEREKIDESGLEASLKRMGVTRVVTGKRSQHEDHAGHAHDGKQGEHGEEKHDHDHTGGLLGPNTELIFALTCGALLLVGFLIEKFAASLPGWLPTACYIGAYVFGGAYTLREAYDNLKLKRFEIDTLMLVAAAGAAALGSWAEGALLLFLFSLGHALEHYAMGRAKRAIEALAELAPDTAIVIRGESTTEIPVGDLQLGDRVLVRPNERLPADGFLLKGNSSINQAPVTGESIPVDKRPVEDAALARSRPDSVDAASRVFAGTINGAGAIEVEVTKRAEDSALARVVKMVSEAETRKSATQRFTDRFERIFVPAVLALAFLLLFAWVVVDEPFRDSFYRAMAVLVAASPCALAIATPSAVLSGIARAARGGVLIKGGAPLEDLGSLKAMAFDKTGTLTEGRPRITDVVAVDGASETELLQVAVAVESLSDHPLAAAIARDGRSRLDRGKLPTASDLENLIGRGVKARLGDQPVWIGKAEMFGADGVPALGAAAAAAIAALREQGRTTMVVRLGDRELGAIGLMDTPREAAKQALMRLKAMGIERMIMISGDHQKVAQAVAKEVGLDEAWGDLMPEDKVEAIRKLRDQDKVAMVGDGVNDAPAMANATVGIAMGAAGSDVALETADVALMADDLKHLPFAVGLSRHTRGIIRQNVFVSLGIVAFLVPATIFGLGIGPAVAVHEGSTLLVVFNALRLLAYKDRS
ncbi:MULTISPECIES: heavy metal translocating P-type ATPase [Xanthomonas]|uniref:P-type Zn(2+) transporter n=1 Tax=Xanthomonas euvesicatoria TaxID=456327 RepID=A0AAX4FQ52_XANEU|nr:heavy metal translocating P-type ATPase [Xanthomonas euvesicatoria]WOP46269.1 heavy metal translocating P-type ATPase [Xanthomonas euvesicatoria]WOP50521.1 heavy metal translocating P-type ATPase [Xanthomonas euvesicatoria]WOP54696.1 heavy metal translocating P-type ATPase [Xanthomonas euvesicatoria]WOP58802.1 heavy metal translocating P-type ATPase [Xanthomonas euvesicatoria]